MDFFPVLSPNVVIISSNFCVSIVLKLLKWMRLIYETVYNIYFTDFLNVVYGSV